jgi:hypothetical protein
VAVKKSTEVRRFRRGVGLGKGATTFSSSRRICRWQWRGRAASVGDALLPCLPCWSRDRVVVYGDGGHGSWSWACLVAAWRHGDAQLAARWSRACSRWPGSACPGRVRGARSRRPRHGAATTGRVCSGDGRAHPRPGLC